MLFANTCAIATVRARSGGCFPRARP